MLNPLRERVDQLVDRLRAGYENIGYDERNPFLYFVYDPQDERRLQALLGQLPLEAPFTAHLLDLLPLTIESLSGQEERREKLLNNPVTGAESAHAIVRLWARETNKRIEIALSAMTKDEHPIMFLYGTAALHPIGNPSQFVALLSEHLPCNPHTGRPAPIVVCIPGFYPPQTSRSYQFLSQTHPVLTFYAGEDI